MRVKERRERREYLLKGRKEEPPWRKRKEREGEGGGANQRSAREAENSVRCTAIDLGEGLKCSSGWHNDVTNGGGEGGGQRTGTLGKRKKKNQGTNVTFTVYTPYTHTKKNHGKITL